MRRSNGKQEPRSEWRTLCLTFPVELVNFIDALAWEMLEESGCRHKLDRMSILRAVVRVVKEAGFKAGGAKSEDELAELVLRQIEERRGQSRGKK